MKFAIVLLMGILMMSVASAAEWDNTYTYDKNTRTATVKNLLGFGETIAKIQLISPRGVRVGLGYQKVAEMKLTQLDKDYQNFFDMNFHNISKNNAKFNRQFEWRYSMYEWEMKEQKSLKCKWKTLNSTYQEVCEMKGNGTEVNTSKHKWEM